MERPREEVITPERLLVMRVLLYVLGLDVQPHNLEANTQGGMICLRQAVRAF
jgi:hypothetical protein